MPTAVSRSGLRFKISTQNILLNQQQLYSSLPSSTYNFIHVFCTNLASFRPGLLLLLILCRIFQHVFYDSKIFFRCLHSNLASSSQYLSFYCFCLSVCVCLTEAVSFFHFYIFHKTFSIPIDVCVALSTTMRSPPIGSWDDGVRVSQKQCKH